MASFKKIIKNEIILNLFFYIIIRKKSKYYEIYSLIQLLIYRFRKLEVIDWDTDLYFIERSFKNQMINKWIL